MISSISYIKRIS
ncbi:hypothetical protein CGLO_17267 [Colletotrichum gloeosporioides Cg-14]|uniref:Uncharacterized protein n=1 Tax=Colletotrichum gloeosporioides (strain Cg-14) TaxID=1237896 RepID=T0JX37_COLGC|nr:hypothetical protein CGLO_17267 [Colletotrichum gloeosporioides Cg-14]